MLNKTEVQYGVIHTAIPNELHRGPMGLDSAMWWIRTAVEEGGVAPDAFKIVRREMTPWQVIDNDPA